MSRTITPEQNIQLALDIRRGRWLLHDAASLLPLAISLLEHREIVMENAVRDFIAREYDIESRDITGSQKSNTPCVAVIPISGIITKYDSCGTIGALTYAQALVDAANDPNVVGCVLAIDSGGGISGAVPFVTAAIRKFKATSKPLLVHTDLCASAAYWIASQCDAIFCDNRIASSVGSIGAYCSFVDDTGAMEQNGYKVHEVYARESSDKNLSYREAREGKYELLQDQLSHIVQAFHTDVKAGRPMLKADTRGVLTGGMFFADAALEVGLIDGIATLQETVENVFVRASIHSLK